MIAHGQQPPIPPLEHGIQQPLPVAALHLNDGDGIDEAQDGSSETRQQGVGGEVSWSIHAWPLRNRMTIRGPSHPYSSAGTEGSSYGRPKKKCDSD